MASARVKALIDDLKNLDGNEYEEFLKRLEIVDEAREDEEIKPETDDNEGKEETDMTEDEKQIAEAKKAIEEKGKDTQTEKDRIDESVGEQERLDGDEDSQDAKDRVDESEAAEKADDERHEDFEEDKLSRIERLIMKLVDKLVPEKEEASAVENAAKETYGLGNGVFSDTKGTNAEKVASKEDVAKIMNKIMR